MRSFVYTDAGSNKFWNIERKGKSFTVTWGKVGTAGQSQTKTFADESKAIKEHDKLIAEKLRKGYAETTAGAAPARPESLRAALEQALLDNPDDLASYHAYADYLTEQGNPQGEFVRVQLALEDRKVPAAERKKLQAREKALLKAHRDEWVGKWADLAPGTGPEGRGQLDFPGPKPFRFVRGILAGVTVDEMRSKCAREFVRALQTRLVRELRVGGLEYEDEYEEDEDEVDEGGAADGEPATSVFPRWPYFGNLRLFQFGWTSDEVYGDFCNFQCHLDGSKVVNVVQKMTRLEELYLFAHRVDAKKLFGLRLPNLRVLQLYHSYHCPLEKLAANAAMGKLTHLLLHPHALEYGEQPYIDLKGLKALVKSPHLKSLTHLRLRLAGFGDEGVKEIVNSGILKRLKALDLRHGRVGDAGAKLLANCPDARGLEELDLSRNELTEEGVAALKSLKVRELHTEHQHASTAGRNPDDGLEVFNEADYE
jgi:uncharacterized protein (TIGR02996 family)